MQAKTDGDIGPTVERSDLTDLTKDELYEVAQEIDLEGRSSMSRDELAENIAAADDA